MRENRYGSSGAAAGRPDLELNNRIMSTASPRQPPATPPELAISETSPFSNWRLAAIAVAAAVIMFLVSAGLDSVIVHEHESRLTAIQVSDILGGVVAGALMFRLLLYERERRARLRRKMAIISDMNHHVRNALQVISFQTFSAADKEQLETIRESMERIQWALKEILPKL